jgi:DNA uptake protein ComE-like DNA-binding protein
LKRAQGLLPIARMNARVLVVLVALAGCAATEGSEDDGAYAASLTAAEAQRVLDLVNYPAYDQTALDDTIGLDARAAAAIAAHRAGVDGKYPSVDDDPFDALAELDDVSYVGATALAKLLAYAEAHPAPARERIENVWFEGWQAEIVVWGANTVPVGVLNGLLDNRAAANVIAARPFANLAAVGNVALIGPNALTALRGQSRTWWFARANHAPASLAGTFDGVTFDEPTAAKALEIANTRTRTQMVEGGVYGNGASVIVGNRPYDSLAAVAAVAGVGASTMQTLHAYATSLLVAPHGTVPEDGECAATSDCGANLVCAGTTIYDTGTCRPAWMAGTFTSTTDHVIPDGGDAVTSSLQVSGLATVPEDAIVHLDIDHPNKAQLYITLTQPSSGESLIWDVDSAGLARVVIGYNLERDSAVNGTWTLAVRDIEAGDAGVLRGWSLELTSRYD